MKSAISSSSKYALGLFLSLWLPIGSVYAVDYSQNRDRWIMPASSANLEPTKINWGELQVNSNIQWLRQMQTNIKALFNHEADMRNAQKAGGGSTQQLSGGNPSNTIQDK